MVQRESVPVHKTYDRRTLHEGEIEKTERTVPEK
jgi:hypothetical protein